MSRIAWCWTSGHPTPDMNNDPIEGFEGTFVNPGGSPYWGSFKTLYGGHVWEDGLPGDVQPTMSFTAVWTPETSHTTPTFTQPVLVGGEPASGFSVYYGTNPPHRGVLVITGFADGVECENQLAVTVATTAEVDAGYGELSWEELGGDPPPLNAFWTRFVSSHEAV